jgi:hypothetical protein
MRKLLLLIPAVAITAAACGGTSSTSASGPQGEAPPGATPAATAPAGSHGEVPLGATPAAGDTSGPQFDDRTWHDGDCLHEPSNNQEMAATHASFWKVSCTAANASWRIVAQADGYSSTFYKTCLASPEYVRVGNADPVNAETLAGDHAQFCLVRAGL